MAFITELGEEIMGKKEDSELLVFGIDIGTTQCESKLVLCASAFDSRFHYQYALNHSRSGNGLRFAKWEWEVS